jgi:hypothetical protein
MMGQTESLQPDLAGMRGGVPSLRSTGPMESDREHAVGKQPASCRRERDESAISTFLGDRDLGFGGKPVLLINFR